MISLAGNDSTPSNQAVGLIPRSLAAADFNGDGKLDLAAVSSLGNNVRLLFNDPGPAAVVATGGALLTTTEHQPTVVASFTDPGGPGYLTDYAATVTSDNGITAPGVITFDPSSNVFFVAVNGLETGTQTLTVSVAKAGSVLPPVKLTRPVSVQDAPLVLTGTPVTATVAAPFTGVMASFTDPAHGPPGDFSATIAWGDGSSSVGTVTPSGAGFTVTGSHTYAVARLYHAGVTVADVGGASASVTDLVPVAAPALTVFSKTAHFTEATLLGGTVLASFSSPDPHAFAGQYAATINWGDGTPLDNGTVAADGAGFDVLGGHAYATHGSYSITVNIVEGANVTPITSTAAVDYTALSGSAQSTSVTGGQTFTGVVASFRDPDPRINSARYKATIVWPDGSTSTGASAAVTRSPSRARTSSPASPVRRPSRWSSPTWTVRAGP